MSLAILLLLVAATSANEAEVSIAKGKLQGAKIPHKLGEHYFAFRGIPYAKPPTKELRFQPPVEVDAWDGVRDASQDGEVCPQWDISQAVVVGDENCLVLNVYTPKIDEKKRAVMVYFHGGAFIMGGGASFFFGPGYLIDEDVVVVTFNYRLGPLGFLATKDGTLGGNQALQDQIMVLNWVRDNIVNFGGDPNRVTLFGEDAGAASITLLTMAPLAKGLFHGAIALSGNALCDQYFQFRPEEASTDLAARMECATDNGEDIVNCLMRKQQQAIISASQDMAMFWSFPRWFAPTVDGKIIPDTPDKLLLQGKFAKIPFVQSWLCPCNGVFQPTMCVMTVVVVNNM